MGNKDKQNNPAKTIKPSPLPITKTRQKGKDYRFTLNKEKKAK